MLIRGLGEGVEKENENEEEEEEQKTKDYLILKSEHSIRKLSERATALLAKSRKILERHRACQKLGQSVQIVLIQVDDDFTPGRLCLDSASCSMMVIK